MATAEKLAIAQDAIRVAQAAAPGAFQDKAGDALDKSRIALLACQKESPELLDKMGSDAEMVGILELIVAASERKARRGRVKECLKVLLERPVWQYAATTNEEFKSKLLEFLKDFSDMSEIVAKIEAGIERPAEPEDVEDSKAPKREKSAAELEAAKESGAKTLELLRDGLGAMKDVDYKLPSGPSTVVEADKAAAGFQSFYSGVARLDSCYNPTVKERFGKNTEDVEVFVERISADTMPRILEFLVSVHEARAPMRNQVIYVVNKFAMMFPRFQAIVDLRNAPDSPDRLPWLGGGYVASEEVPPVATDLAGSDAKASSPAVPCTRSVIKPGETKEVVWIDSRPKAYQSAMDLRNNDIIVQGFHDDWSSGESKAHEEALTYILSVLKDAKKHLVGIVINNGSEQKNMLKAVNNYCFENGLVHPFYVACTKAAKEDFDGCDISFISVDWGKCEAAILEDVTMRMA